MSDESPRHLIITKVNVISESRKHTVLSETFSLVDMKVKYPLPQEFLNQKNPIIFQIVYQNESKSYIFNVHGTVNSESPTTVVFLPESQNVIQQFLAEVGTKKKFVVPS
jgi:hypothetical protein